MTTKVSDPKPCGLYTSRVVKRDRKFYGEIRSYRGGRLNIYWAHRRTDEYFRVDESWAIDVDTVTTVKAYGVTHIGVLVEDGTRLLAPIAIFGPAGKAQGVTCRNYSKHVGAKGKLGALQWYVPERLFVVHRPPEDRREETLLERMAIKGRGS